MLIYLFLINLKDIVKYTDFYYSGLQKIAYISNKSMEDIMLVGIEQAPVAAVKLMELAGVKTTYCPISGLITFNESVDKYVTKKTEFESLKKYVYY